jgi:hypothetical protein
MLFSPPPQEPDRDDEDPSFIRRTPVELWPVRSTQDA